MSRVMTYKGYSARVGYDDEDGIFFGQIAGISDGIGFHADNVEALRTAFRKAVDDYVETCAKVGKEPQPRCFPIHPGEVLREEFMAPHKLTAYAVAKACHIPRTRIERIAREEIGISGDSALRLGKFFGVDPQFWLNLQSRYEIETAKLVEEHRSAMAAVAAGTLETFSGDEVAAALDGDAQAPDQK